jgi:hypothetical protein
MKCLVLSLGLLLVGCGGKDGASGITISSTVNCSKYVGSVIASYEIVSFSSGEKFVRCSIDDTTRTTTEARYLVNGQDVTATAKCLLTYDLDTASSGVWIFTEVNGVRSVVYDDATSGVNGRVDTYAASDCTVL